MKTMSPLSKPIKFRPILKQTPWGGNRIVPFKHLDETTDHIGESWDISSVNDNISIVAEGAYAGTTLNNMISRFQADLVGHKVYADNGNRFPLLIKFIDAHNDLSIQVHPNDKIAGNQGYNNGKTELWYVLDAKPEASLLCGFNKKVTKDEYRTRACDGTICDIIKRFPVKEYDCFFIPAGQVHAICSGIFLIEIQQTSDTTYRIFDYNRKGIDGKLRPLHINEAEQAIDFNGEEPGGKIDYDFRLNHRNEMVKCPYFTTSSYGLTLPMTIPLKTVDSFVILIACRGRFTISLDNNEAMQVNAGETILIPASAASALITPLGNSCHFLSVHID